MADQPMGGMTLALAQAEESGLIGVEKSANRVAQKNGLRGLQLPEVGSKQLHRECLTMNPIAPWIAGAFIWATFATAAFGQIEDIIQKKDWLYIHELGKEIGHLSMCTKLLEDTLNPLQRFRAVVKYHNAADQIGQEVEIYIDKYVETRERLETPDSFRYRVWLAVILALNQEMYNTAALGRDACLELQLLD